MATACATAGVKSGLLVPAPVEEAQDGDKDQWACLKEVIAYGLSIGVKTAVWVHSNEVPTPETRLPYLRRVKECGAVGIKIDFMPPANHVWTQWYEETSRDCAEVGLFVDYHGAVKPTGRERTWPHELAREAIRGHEWHITRYGRVLPRSHDCILPFCRLVQGRADYTPMVFEQRELIHFTWARELAQGVVFSAPFLCFGDRPGTYLESPMADFVKTIPAVYDETRRAAIRRAHSATHLLQKALRDVLGDHVHQAGSLVEPDFLRFDFTHFSAVTAEELQRVEDAVNEAILKGLSVETKEMPIDEARKAGATALFGEKYGDIVRVVNMGGYSVELCGGTHLDNTAKAGAFHISSEGSVASGVRRIEASTGLRTLRELSESLRMLSSLAAAYKASPAELPARLEQQAGELREARRVIEQYKARESAGGADAMLKNAVEVGGLHVVTCSQADCDAAKLRQIGDVLRDKDSAVVAVVAAVNGGKITFQCVCGKDAVARGVKAGDIIRAITAIAGGKGGGKPDSAMGGGNDLSKLDEALAAVKGLVADKV